MIKTVLFDLDGTLLNRDESVQRFINGQHDRLYIALGHIEKNTYINRFIELDCRGYVWKDKVYQQLVAEFGITVITWQELLEDYLNNFQYCCVPFPNLSSMLESLKGQGIALGMITNGRGQFQLDNVRALGIEGYFDTILISEWEGVKKPDVLIFERALEKLGVSPAESIFVGDHPEKDIAAAKNAGMTSVWKKDINWERADADYIIDDLSELPNIIKTGEIRR